MSGTSLNGIDAALVTSADSGLKILATLEHTYSDETYERLAALVAQSAGRQITIEDAGELHDQLAHCYADAVTKLLAASNTTAADIVAIGNHGQTIGHYPDAEPAYTVQIGNPQLLANLTGITTVGNFRQADMDAGGQGAPLAPAFHRVAFGSADEVRAAVNIGGIANITILAPDVDVIGFDVGPGNCLMDEWSRKHRDKPFDSNGDWAATGSVAGSLLDALLSDPWLQLPPPKSTGREHFHLGWLEQHLPAVKTDLPPEDIQATLCEFTARCIADALVPYQPAAVAVCGGGAHNTHLMQRLTQLIAPAPVHDSRHWGIGPDWVEAAAFAWLAKARLDGQAGNLPSVTGANASVLLGNIFEPV